MTKYWLLVLVASRLFAFYDEELTQLWSAIPDIQQPTLEEYQLIDHYLAAARRPYLDRLRNAEPFSHDRMQRILAFRLIGSHNQMPLCEQYDFHVTEFTEGRCIVLYSSSNGIYPQKAKTLLREIKESGYSGHVLLRIGGFPNTSFGGLKLCHVPYAFKAAALEEAKNLGFKEVLWMDLAIHPLKNFEPIFWEIEQRGYFFTEVGTLEGNRSTHLFEAAKALDIDPSMYATIPHISSAMIGLNMENSRALQLLKDWHRAIEEVYPQMTWWPEELSLSAIAWRLGCEPVAWLGSVICAESELPELQRRPTVQFYLDCIR